MLSEMKNLTTKGLAEAIFETIAGYQNESPKIIIINERNCKNFGDVYFPLNIQAWKGYVDIKTEAFQKSKNIMEYCSYRIVFDLRLAADINLFGNYISDEISMIYPGVSLTLKIINAGFKEFVSVIFNKNYLMCQVCKNVITERFNYGRKKIVPNKIINISLDPDDNSELTNERLKLLQKVSLNLLKCQGFDTETKSDENSYIFTVRSEAGDKNICNRYLCGAVLNCKAHNKERLLSWSSYKKEKTDKIREINMKKVDSVETKNCIEEDITKIINAAINYELLSTKHCQPVILRNNDDIDVSVKEGPFVLYNNVRMNAILAKANYCEVSHNMYKIIPIAEFEVFEDFCMEEEWFLVYNYIMKYPDILEASVKTVPKLEINVASIWIFVSSLCHAFSKYYRKSRILMHGHKDINVLTSQRIHILRALKVVLENALYLLNIEEVDKM